MTRRRSSLGSGAALALAAVVGACQPQPSGGIVPADQMQLSVANGTSIELMLVVNGQEIQSVGPLTRTDVPASRLPALPWSAEVRLPGGRILVALTVHAGDVSSTAVPNGGAEQRGIGARADLSCGRIDLYSGPILLGPPPDPGTPGDCDP